jgi:YHS domain-containing protein
LAVNAADEKKFSAKCVVAGKPDAKEDKNAAYKGGKVYFCCDNCKAKFEKDSTPFALAANTQLITTGQAKQVKCPISGQPVDDAQVSEVSGVKVKFCCGNCKGKVDKAEGDEKSKLVFGDDAFKKGFEVKASK